MQSVVKANANGWSSECNFAVELIFNDDGSVTLRWALRNEGEHQAICPEVEPVEEGAEEDETPF